MVRLDVARRSREARESPHETLQSVGTQQHIDNGGGSMSSPGSVRRALSIVSCALVAATAFAGAAHAQSYPSRPIEFVVHTSPGGGTDTFARAVADMLGRDKAISQAVTVSNRTGGSGG